MSEIYYLEDIFLAGWIIKFMIHSLTIFSYGIYLDREMLTPFTNIIHLLKSRDSENLTNLDAIVEMVIENFE